jgi:hypothetical protein
VSTRTFSPKQSQVHILPRIFLTRCGRQRRGQRRRSSHDSALALSGGGPHNDGSHPAALLSLAELVGRTTQSDIQWDCVVDEYLATVIWFVCPPPSSRASRMTGGQTWTSEDAHHGTHDVGDLEESCAAGSGCRGPILAHRMNVYGRCGPAPADRGKDFRKAVSVKPCHVGRWCYRDTEQDRTRESHTRYFRDCWTFPLDGPSVC